MAWKAIERPEHIYSSLFHHKVIVHSANTNMNEIFYTKINHNLLYGL